ncbi:hypothetical protein Nepgr_031533 [Nepenthes gracilis]|uniref:Polygalacturonase n=1 Tax=Nepenthes gracilis TaxID=150966 RepID=A0AAD3TGX0_NEPGR|nr:hypothetical protein Nepgr_031533 [Nepenthes gracilis]
MVIPTVIFILFLYPSLTSAASNYNVADFGAIPDGKTDSSAGFLRAWTAACGSAGRSTISVPTGKFLIRQPVVFTGSQCKSSGVMILIQGSLVAPSDYRVLGESTTWLSFQCVTGVTISGGILDGQGGSLWTCKNSGKGGCPTGATTLGFTNSNNIVIDGMTSINSQLYHIVINGCKNVKIQGVKVSASGDSPNTDGIHVQFSTGVTILNSRAATGDDCVSVGAGTTGLWIENFSCGPGHGISIGSLGKAANEPGVKNVTVKTVKFTGTDNGVRIKSWGRPSNGFVTGVLFQHITMADVKNPIIIDQNYCPDDNGCPQKVSGVKISNVMYQDIHGSSATEVAVKFDCSSEHPCTDLRLQDVKLTYKSDQAALSSCSNADGSSSGFVVPSSCL